MFKILIRWKWSKRVDISSSTAMIIFLLTYECIICKPNKKRQLAKALMLSKNWEVLLVSHSLSTMSLSLLREKAKSITRK